MNRHCLQSKEVFALVRREVNRWDPVGLIACGCPEDEYDCVTATLMSGLYNGADATTIAIGLDRILQEHFAWRGQSSSAEFTQQVKAVWASLVQSVEQETE